MAPINFPRRPPPLPPDVGRLILRWALLAIVVGLILGFLLSLL
jgi:hypothetical protein